MNSCKRKTFLSLPLLMILIALDGNSQQYFVDETESRLPGISDASTDAEFGDLDRDGNLDVIVANNRIGMTERSYLVLNNGYGVFREEHLHFFEYDLALAEFWGVALGDVELDGDFDAFYTNINDDTEAHHYLFVNDGQANFTDRSSEQLPPHYVISGSDAHFVDVDSDMDLDLAMYEWQTGANKLWGNLSFASGHYYNRIFNSGNDDSNDGAWFDVDGDWDLDCIIVNGNGYPNRIMINYGEYFFEEGSERLPSSLTMDNDIEFFDIDGDRDLDVYIASGFVPGDDKVWMNDGNGYFTDESAGRISQYGDHSLGVCIGDIDNDGDLDIFVANSSVAGTHSPRIYVNEGTGHFTDETDSRYPIIDEESSYGAFGDVDNDGDLDLYVVNHGFEDGEQNRLLINVSTPDSFPPVINRTLIHEDTADTAGPYMMMTEVWDNVSRNIGELSVVLNYRIDQGGFVAAQMFNCGGYIYRQRIGGFQPGTTVSYYIEAVDRMGNASFDPATAPDSLYSFMVTGTGIEMDDSGSMVPKSFSLSQNYPNPFNPSTTISFSIPGDSEEPRHVSLMIYDIRGKLVRELIDSEFTPGSHCIVWNARDEKGEQVPSGVYFCRLSCGDWKSTKKMTLVR